MAEVGNDVLESGTRLEEDEGVGFVWVRGFLEDVEYRYDGCVKVASPNSSPACACCGFGFEADDLAVG